MGLMEPQAVLSRQGWVEGDGPSSSKKCLLDMLRREQLSSDHQDGMRGRVECHQHSSDMKNHVSEWQNLVMQYREKREVVQELSPEASQKWDVATWTPQLSKIPWRTCLRGKTNQWSAVPEMPFANRADGRSWSLTISKAVNHVKSSGPIQQDKYWRFGIWSCQS